METNANLEDRHRRLDPAIWCRAFANDRVRTRHEMPGPVRECGPSSAGPGHDDLFYRDMTTYSNSTAPITFGWNQKMIAR